MRNNRSIKNWAKLITVITAFLVIASFLYEKTLTLAQTSTPISDEFAINTISVGDNQNNNVSAIRNDSDAEGNQAYTWIENGLRTSCSTVLYQIYNRAGVSITQPNTVSQDCTGSTSYSSPDIAFTDNGLAITYAARPSSNSNGGYNIYLAGYHDDGSTIYSGGVIQINDDPANPVAPQPRVAADPHTNYPIGITWSGCQDGACATIDNVIFQGINSNTGNRINANNTVINPDTTTGTSLPNISIGSNLFMITWQQNFGTSGSKILARGISAHDNTQLIPVIIVSDTGDYEGQPDIAGVQTAPPQDSPNEFTEKFFITYTSHQTQDINSPKEILIKKIACDDIVNQGTGAITYTCAPTSRNGQNIIVRANPSNSDNYLPAITAFHNHYDIKRIQPAENTSIDSLTVAWISSSLDLTATHPTTLLAQSYTNTLVKSGNLIIASTNPDISLDHPAISSNQDGHYTLTYGESGQITSTSYAKTYPSNYLLVGPEKIVNAPDTNLQQDPKVAINSDGKYVIAYTNNNSNDKDIIYALFDHSGNPIKNTFIATQTTAGDQYNPHVDFIKADRGSSDYGKFIISWDGNGSGDADGVFYRLFNADGTPAGDETLVNQNASNLQSSSDISVAKNNQIAFVYNEGPDLNSQTIVLAYYNNGSFIYHTVSSAATAHGAHVALSPMADGTFDFDGKSKFSIGWTEGTNGQIVDGYLHTGNSVNLLTTTNPGGEVYELKSSYNVDFASNLTVAHDGFFYTASTIDTDGKPKVVAHIFNSSFTYDLPFNSDHAVSTAIDPATGNIITLGTKDSDYQNLWDKKKVLLSPSDRISDYTPGGAVTNETFTNTADISTTNNLPNSRYPTYINNFSNNGNIPFGFEAIGSLTTITPDIILPGQQLSFNADISNNFTLGQTITGATSGASGFVSAITPFYIIVELGVSSPSFVSGDLLDNSPYNDSITSAADGSIVFFLNSEGTNFPAGSTIRNSNRTASGDVIYSAPNLIFTIPTNGIFDAHDTVIYFTQQGFNSPDKIQYPSATISQLSYQTINGETSPIWTQRGPSFATNHYFTYGQYLENLSVAYNTSSTESSEQLGVSVYANNLYSSIPTYPDANGVYQQIIENPFTVGRRQDLSPQTQQQINPGGKYIIVPRTIDFGNVSRGTTVPINFADLSPRCIQVTDLDGTDFDLTVSMTDLINTTNSSQTIPKQNLIIENSDGTNPPISTTYSFSNSDDVTLDPSTGIGQQADLGSTRTLLKKNNANTGSWTFCPRAYLTIPGDAQGGVVSGTMTFTFI